MVIEHFHDAGVTANAELGHTVSPRDEALSELTLRQLELELQNAELISAQARLQSVLESYRQLFDHAPVAYLVMSQGGIVAANLVAARLLGVPREELVGTRLSAYVAAQDADAYARHELGVLASEEAQGCDIVLEPRGDAAIAVRLQSMRVSAETQHWRSAILDVGPRPLARQRTQPAPKSELTPAPLPDSGTIKTRILVVDDDLLMRDATCRLLQEAGYDVLQASNAACALELLREHAGLVRLVLSEATLPDLGGADLMRAARHIQRNVQTRFMSGDDQESLQARGALSADLPLLRKPFGYEELLDFVRDALAEPLGPDSALSGE